MAKVFFMLIAFALIPSAYNSAEAKLDDRLISNAFEHLSKDYLGKFQSMLKDQNISTACNAELMKLTTTPAGLRNLFPMLDALGKPSSGLFQGNYLWPGAFSECADMKNFKYCLAGFNLKMYAFTKPILNQYGALGACAPQKCNPNDIRLILNKLPLALNVPPFVTANISFPEQTTLSVYGNSVMCEERDKSYPRGTVATLTICGIILTLCLFGTILELLIDWLESPLSCIKDQRMHTLPATHATAYKVNGANIVDDTNSLGSQNSLSDDVEQLIQSSPTKTSAKDIAVIKFLICFSLVKNTKAVLSTDAPDRAILSINGIRTISMWWVILGHCYAIGETAGGVENLTEVGKVLNRFTFLALDNAFFSVDSFFLLSGLLVAYLGLKRLEAKGKLPVWQFYLHRYIRLTPSYGLVILFYMYIVPFIGKGPAFSTITAKTMAKPCEDYWWTNILYINNFHPKKLGKECLGWGWYLANDMQFYIISPIILYIMYKLGIIGAIVSNGFLIAASAIVTGSLVGHYKLHALEVVADAGARPKQGVSFEDVIYTKPYCRIQPYLVGLVLGFFLFKKYSFRGPFKWLFFLIGWIVAIVLGLTVVYGTWASSKKGGKPFNEAENVIYASLSRFTWAVAVAWVIFACHNGFGGLIQSFLSWRAFMPLSRLTYGAYLIHPITITVFYQSKLSTRAYTDMDFAFQFVSVTVMSYAAAFILAVSFEYPILNLDKMIFSQN